MKADKIKLSLGLLILITIFSWVSSCTHKANIADIPEVCFEGEVLPIFLNSCAISGCHDGNGESGLSLDSYQNISHYVIPGDPGASRIYKAITTTFGEGKMPPDQPLSEENRILIRLWIEQGAGLTTCPDKTTSGKGSKGFSNN